MIDKSTLNILILDDDPFMLKLLSQMLVNHGFTSTITLDKAQLVLELYDAQKVRPDVIMLDLNMPDMDGIQFVRQLVERRYTGGLIMMSGEGERVLQTAEKLIEAHDLVFLGRLQKPVNSQKLMALLGEWVPPSQAGPAAQKKIYSAQEVQAAITNRELVNYYQPKVEIATREAVGVETLVRWRHPVDGLVFPDQFIGVAEAHGLIDDLTRTVVSGALAQARSWQRAGLTMQIACNVSMDNLSSLDFPDFISALAAEAGIPPEHIVLEVTESRLLQDVRSALDVLTRLRLKHFSLSIDDFGTGHSSLAQLRDIPFDELKIDRGFVNGAATDETIKAIYASNLALGTQLGMKVVAEGVEDQDDWDFLQRTGCPFAQGYFIAKPMPGDALPDWVSDWHRARDTITAAKV